MGVIIMEMRIFGDYRKRVMSLEYSIFLIRFVMETMSSKKTSMDLSCRRHQRKAFDVVQIFFSKNIYLSITIKY